MAHGLLLKSFIISVVFCQVFVSSAPTSAAVDHQQRPLINKEILNSADTSSEDEEVEELHKWGWRMESSNSIHHGGLNTTRAKQPAKEVAAVEPVAKDDGKRAGQTQKADSMLGEFSSSKDTPRDMAEYIFWTGDEQGVTGAVMEFITQGLMSEKEGIRFLEEVRYDLRQMKLRFGNGVGAAAAATSAAAAAPSTAATSSKNKYSIEKDDDDDADDDIDDISAEIKTIEVITSPKSLPISDQLATSKVQQPEQEKPHQGEIVVTSFSPKNAAVNNHSSSNIPAEKEMKHLLIDQVRFKPVDANKDKDASSHHSEHDELELSELVSNEFTLEEIIYQLARILFSQSLSHAGNPEAEESLKKFADFLEKESKDGKMSPQLQKKVLDVLLMSLFDAMGEQGHSSFTVPKVAADLDKSTEKHT